jgi:hypothetical protein
VLAGILIALVVTAGWWLVCARLPRLGVVGSVFAIGWITVGLFRARNTPPIVDPAVPTETNDLFLTVIAIAPLLAAAIDRAIAMTRWTERAR